MRGEELLVPEFLARPERYACASRQKDQRGGGGNKAVMRAEHVLTINIPVPR